MLIPFRPPIWVLGEQRMKGAGCALRVAELELYERPELIERQLRLTVARQASGIEELVRLGPALEACQADDLAFDYPQIRGNDVQSGVEEDDRASFAIHQNAPLERLQHRSRTDGEARLLFRRDHRFGRPGFKAALVLVQRLFPALSLS